MLNRPLQRSAEIPFFGEPLTMLPSARNHAVAAGDLDNSVFDELAVAS